jgi:hypothetical protein
MLTCEDKLQESIDSNIKNNRNNSNNSNNCNNSNNSNNSKQIKATQIIQKYTNQYFNKKLGMNWKDIINYKWTNEELDYYCYRKNIMDPWHDYCLP